MSKRVTEYTVSEILSEDPVELLNLFKSEYNYQIPETLDSIQDLKQAGRLIGKLMNAYSYMAQLSVYAKIAVRDAKRNKLSKDEIDTAIDRKAVIDVFVETLSMQYKAISRVLTIKQQINEELKMTDSR